MPAISRSWKKQGRILPREQSPANLLILDFWPPELRGDKFLLFRATQFVVLAMATLGNKHNDQGLGSHVKLHVLEQQGVRGGQRGGQRGLHRRKRVAVVCCLGRWPREQNRTYGSLWLMVDLALMAPVFSFVHPPSCLEQVLQETFTGWATLISLALHLWSTEVYTVFASFCFVLHCFLHFSHSLHLLIHQTDWCPT